MDFVVGESFDLTESIKREVDEALGKVRHFMKPEVPISVHLDKTGPKEFSVRLMTHYFRHDFVAEDRDADFHKALHDARDHLIRQIKEYQSKKRDLQRN